MATLTTSKDGKLVLLGQHGEEAIHVIHCDKTIEGIREDVATPYIVAEQFTNHPRLHLVTDFSQDEAAQQVDTYLREKEGYEESAVFSVVNVTLHY